MVATDGPKTRVVFFYGIPYQEEFRQKGAPYNRGGKITYSSIIGGYALFM
jgi:hypothetical protein